MAIQLEMTAEDTTYEMDSGKVQPKVETKEPPKEEAKAEVKTEQPKEEVKVETKQEEKKETEQEKEPAKRPSWQDTIRELRAERRELKSERQKLVDQIRQQESNWTKAQERLARLETTKGKQDEPDRNADPDAYFQAKIDKLELKLSENDKAQEEQRKREAEVSGMQAKIKELSDYELEWLKDTREDFPDYKDAVDFGYKARMEDLDGMLDQDGEPMSEAAKKNAVAQQILAVLDRAHKGNKNPVELIYNFAKRRGYKAAEKQEDKPANGKGTEKDKQDLEEKLRTLQDGQAASKTIGKGGSGNSDLTLEDLVAMPDEEFDKFAGDRKLERKLFGG